MSTADLSVIAMAVVALASTGTTCLLHLKVADRLRLVNPPKEQKQDAAAAAEPIATIRRTGT